MAKNLIAAAEEMRADEYGYKPTPAQMSVGDIVAHLSEGNDFFCLTIGGSPAPKRAELPKTAWKERLVARLRETFQFCESALAKLDDGALAAKVPFFGGRQVSLGRNRCSWRWKTGETTTASWPITCG